MAANNRGNMRPTNRSPPFLAIGLFVALVILGFNYWNLSVKNGEQFNEISVMERELKLVSAKKTAIEKRAEAIQDKVKYLEDELNKQKGVAGEKSSALATAQNERDTIAQAKDELQTEYNLLKEKLPLCEKEVAELKEAVKIARDELEQKKNEQPHTQTCGESECTNYIASSRDKTLEDIVKVAGSAPLVNLYKDGGNVGKFAETVRSFLANQVAVQQPAQQPTQQLAQQPEQPAQQQPNQPIVGQAQQPGQINTIGNQQQPPAEEVKQDAPKAPESYQPGNTLVSMSQQQQPAANEQQPQVPQPQVAAPVLGDDKRAEVGDPLKQNPAMKPTLNTTNGLAKGTRKATEDIKPSTSSNRTTLSPVQLNTLSAKSKNPEKEIPKTQDEANKIQSAQKDDKLNADKKIEADNAEDLDDADADLEEDEDGAAPLGDKKTTDDAKVPVGDLDKVGNNEDADYDDEADAADDRLKIDEKDQDADEYEYEDDPKDPKVANDNQNDYDDDDDDDNYDDGKANDGPNNKDDGVEEMKMQLDKDKTI